MQIQRGGVIVIALIRVEFEALGYPFLPHAQFFITSMCVKWPTRVTPTSHVYHYTLVLRDP